jgi:hypothetical protein
MPSEDSAAASIPVRATASIHFLTPMLNKRNYADPSYFTQMNAGYGVQYALKDAQRTGMRTGIQRDAVETTGRQGAMLPCISPPQETPMRHGGMDPNETFFVRAYRTVCDT